ncbi:MAG: hypothetical protein [Microvirus sp.]|nr:MAG: hypothetical protein [Microvirus sp.]
MALKAFMAFVACLFGQPLSCRGWSAILLLFRSLGPACFLLPCPAGPCWLTFVRSKIGVCFTLLGRCVQLCPCRDSRTVLGSPGLQAGGVFCLLRLPSRRRSVLLFASAVSGAKKLFLPLGVVVEAALFASRDVVIFQMWSVADGTS